jgi:hypothetical protein
MYLTDEEIDEVARDWGLYSTQDNGVIHRSDFRDCVRELADKLQEKIESDRDNNV